MPQSFCHALAHPRATTNFSTRTLVSAVLVHLPCYSTFSGADSCEGPTLTKAISFYENCTRIVLRAIDEFEVDGHEGSDTRFHCEFLTAAGAALNREDPLSFSFRSSTISTAGFAFTIHTYSESGTFGIEHRVKYTPSHNHALFEKLGDFQNESDFLAHTARSFFIDLTRQVDLTLGQS